MRRASPWSLLGLLLLAPLAAGARGGGAVCGYQDPDGVWHFSNASADPRCKKRLTLRDADAGLYRSEPRGDSAGRAAGPKATAGTREARREPPPELGRHVREAAERYNLSVELLLAVMEVESNYNPRAVSHKGAVGLMQLMPQTSSEMYVWDATDPKANIEGGARYLRILANLYGGDLSRTLAAYNAGPEAVRRAGDRIPPYPETREYVRRVLDRYYRLKGQGDRG